MLPFQSLNFALLLYHIIFTNSGNPEQTPHFAASDIWVCTVCQLLGVCVGGGGGGEEGADLQTKMG